MFLVSLHAMTFPSADLGRVDSFCWRRFFVLRFFCPEPSRPVFEVDDLREELGRHCVAAQCTPFAVS